jgi:hypothetical protein
MLELREEPAMKDSRRNILTRRELLLNAAAGAATAPLRAGQHPSATSGSPSGTGDVFHIRTLDRRYDLHRRDPCTLFAIEVVRWPGNEFGLWLPETVYRSGTIVWGNWWGDNAHQEWGRDEQGHWTTTRTFDHHYWTPNRRFDQFAVTSTLIPDPANSCLWYRHTFMNTGRETLRDLNSQTCFHLVNAPQFISPDGSRIWANLDATWMTIDKVERDKSRDPRRISFLRQGVRAQRAVETPGTPVPKAVHHPLFIAENFAGNACVGIASRNFEKLFNNNDSILRCLHSESSAIRELAPGESAHQDSVLIFFDGDHRKTLELYTTRIEPNWPSS